MRLSEESIGHIKEKEIISLDNHTMIVRINVSDPAEKFWTDDELNYNIYCVDRDYQIIWQVSKKEKSPYSIDGDEDPFCYLGKNDQGEIIADRYSGFEYQIDPETGDVKCIGFHK